MLSTLYTGIRSFFVRMGWCRLAIAIVGILIGFWIVSFFSGNTPIATEPEKDSRTVSVATVRDLSLNISPLTVVGSVTSQSEATVRAESSGQVTAIYKELGDNVTAGTVVAETENASQRAAVLQAQAGVDAAVTGSGVQESALAAAEDSAVTSILSAYAATENAIHGTADDMFSNPDSANPEFNILSSDSQTVINVESARVALSPIISRQRALSPTLSHSANLSAEIATTEAELRIVRDFFDMIIKVLNSGIATQGTSADDLAAFKASATAARTTITTSITALVTARQSLEVAQKNSTTTGSASSALKQAQAALAAARAQLEKTVVRAPISGTINSLSLKRGDYIQVTSPVLTVANNGALEVVAYITESDARELAVGGEAELTGGVTGSVTRIAPAIDPQTKKIEVRVGVTSPGTALINGQSTTVKFARTTPQNAEPARIVIPISALKIGAENTVVFTVSETNTLVAHPVAIGTLLGDRVVIKSGITLDSKIVTDARGHQEGEVVVVQ